MTVASISTQNVAAAWAVLRPEQFLSIMSGQLERCLMVLYTYGRTLQSAGQDGIRTSTMMQTIPRPGVSWKHTPPPSPSPPLAAVDKNVTPHRSSFINIGFDHMMSTLGRWGNVQGLDRRGPSRH